MFTRLVIATVLAATTGLSFAAGEATYEYPQPHVSTVSRAEVKADAIRALRAGLIAQGELSIVAETTMGPTQFTRAQVLAELAEASRLGLVGGGERSIIPTPQQSEQIRLAGLAATMPMLASR